MRDELEGLHYSEHLVRIRGYKTAGVGAVFMALLFASGLSVWMYKEAADVSGLLGLAGLMIYLGLMVTGPVMIVSGLIQAITGYDMERRFW